MRLSVLLLVLALPAPADTPSAPRCPAGMTLLAAGRFTFGPAGVSPDDPYFAPAAAHDVAAFCLDTREVTVAAFRRNAEPARSGECPEQTGGRASVNCVSRTQAAEHCRARGARLPTEIEWEYAARGRAGRRFPWGNEPANFDPLRPGVCLLRQERTGSAGPCEPGASRADRTPEGLFDLGHNVSEWTATLLGPRAVIRGGNWTDRTMEPVTTQRLAREPAYAGPTVGFRCAADPR
jgi:formylglycine-generating enzyme required for sulfatase activity